MGIARMIIIIFIILMHHRQSEWYLKTMKEKYQFFYINHPISKFLSWVSILK